jgi:hypothetical protein
MSRPLHRVLAGSNTELRQECEVMVASGEGWRGSLGGWTSLTVRVRGGAGVVWAPGC